MLPIFPIARKTLVPLLACALTVAVGANEAHAQRAAGTPCLESPGWLSLENGRPKAVAFAELLREVARRDIVLLGEQHDSADHHRWQLHTLAALRLLRPSMVIGFEAFPRRVQPTLERWVAGELSEKAFLELSDWRAVWNYPAELYMPLFQFARMNHIRMVALNVERSLTQAVTREGWDAVPQAQREGVSRPAAPHSDYVDGLFDVYQQHAREGEKPDRAASRNDAGFRNFVAAQTTWDRAMAEALARALRDASPSERPLVVGIIGSGHLRYGHGVPHQLRDLGVASIATLLPIEADAACAGLKTGLADALFVIAKTPQAPTTRPRLGVTLRQVNNEVTLIDVAPDSLAEASGLKRGDRIVTIAEKPVTEVNAVIAAVRGQPEGTWLPIGVQRGNDSVQVIVKFPRSP